MPSGRSDEDRAGIDAVIRFRFFDVNAAERIQPLSKRFGESLRHMLHHHDAYRQTRGQCRQNLLQGTRTAG